MDFNKLINSMTPDVYASLKRAVEIGKWPTGERLTTEQRETCMEAVLVYEGRFVEEIDRVGYIDRGSKAQGELCDDGVEEVIGRETALKWS